MSLVLGEIQLAIQLNLGLVFLLASGGKLLNPSGFARGVALYQIVPKSLISPISLFVILTEVCLAISHVTGYFLQMFSWIGLMLISCFAAAVVINLIQGRSPLCYCFGSGGEAISKRTLLRLLSIALGEVFLLYRHSSVFPLRLTLSNLASGIHSAMVLFAAALWCLSLPDLLYLLRPMRRTLGGKNAQQTVG